VRLDGRTALLTGATGGLGRAISMALAEGGATLVLSSRKREELEALAASLPGDGHRTAVADLAVDGAAERVTSEAGEVDVLVANAGVSGTGRLEDLTEDQVSQIVRVNLEAPIRMARLLVPTMVDRGAGHLVFIASLAGKAASPRSSLYNATKFGLRGFALGLRTDLAREGVGVSVVCPGFVRDAGLFARSGASDGGLGTTTPQRVAAAVVRAIERDRAEVAVGPLRQRALAHIGLAAPGLSARVQSGGAARRIAGDIAAGQRTRAPSPPAEHAEFPDGV
jgi:short-subunit dehydrogenase